MCEMGRRGCLTRDALRYTVRSIASSLRKLGPLPPASIFLAGYDEDPRELWEIPEGRYYILRWVDRLVRTEGITLDRFLATDRELVTACRLSVAGMEDAIELHGDAVAFIDGVRTYQQRTN